MENETEPRLDPRPLLLKRLVWDVFPHDADVVKEIQTRLGLVPDGDDGLEVEHRASDTRINRVAPLGDTLETLSGYAAEVMGQYLVAVLEHHTDGEVETPEGFHEAFAQQNGEIIYDSTYAIICHLMDKGILVYGPKVRG
jgi:hypothetical protein